MTADRTVAAPRVDVAALVAAARAAPGPVGPVHWFARPLGDGVELRTAVRAWTTDGGRIAAGMRLACGAALCNARLAMIAGGHRPLVSYSLRSGLLASVNCGASAVPRARDVQLYRAIGAPCDGKAVEAAVLRGVLRRLGDVQRVRTRVLCGADAERLATGPGGVPWPAGPGGDPAEIDVLVGALANDRIAELRVGRAAQHLRLLAAARLGWRVEVRVGPIAGPVVGRPDPVLGSVPTVWMLLRATPAPDVPGIVAAG